MNVKSTERHVSRRDFLKALASGGMALLFPRKQPRRDVELNQFGNPELMRSFAELKDMVSESEQSLKLVKEAYGLVEVQEPKPMLIARFILANGSNLEKGLSLGQVTLPYKEIQELLYGPSEQEQAQREAMPAITNTVEMMPRAVELVDGFYRSFIKQERGRIAQIIISDENVFQFPPSKLKTELGMSSKPFSTLLEGSFHEIIHGTDKSYNFLFLDVQRQELFSNGVTLTESLKSFTKWAHFLAVRKDYLHDAVFSAAGDELHTFLSSGDIYRVVDELRAMATVNTLLNTPFALTDEKKKNHDQAIGDLAELTREQLFDSVLGWHRSTITSATNIDIVKQTRKNIGSGLAKVFYELLSPASQNSFLMAYSGDLSRYWQGAPGTEPQYLFLNNQTLPDGNEVDWNWDAPTASTQDYMLLAEFGNIVRYYGEIFWEDKVPSFEDGAVKK